MYQTENADLSGWSNRIRITPGMHFACKQMLWLLHAVCSNDKSGGETDNGCPVDAPLCQAPAGEFGTTCSSEGHMLSIMMHAWA